MASSSPRTMMTPARALSLWMGLLAAVSLLGVLIVQERHAGHDVPLRGAKRLALTGDVMDLVFAVKHRDPGAITRMLDAVSDPDSPSYGQYLTLDQLARLTRNDAALDSITAFLRSRGLEKQIDMTVNGEFVVARSVPVPLAHSILKLTGTSAKLPAPIAMHVDFVSVKHNVPQRPGLRTKAGRKVQGYVTPDLINKVYNVRSNHVEDQRATQALFESLGQSYSPSDLHLFQKEFGLPKNDICDVIGPNQEDACNDHPDQCGEANLDVQYMLAMSDGPTTYWSMVGEVEPFLDWAIAVSNDSSAPLVHSISYGDPEEEPAVMRRFDEEIQKLGVRGITVVVSSGDDGVANFDARSDLDKCGFSPSFPASSPYVVSVGATQGPESGREEIACSSDTGGIVTSGGGFSTVFKRPHYQEAAVNDFFTNSDPADLPPHYMYSREGRAYPDVSLLGYNYIIVDGGQFTAESGTSASAPVFAGMLSLVNGRLLSLGRPPVGFVNPLLYKLSGANGVFKDVVKGNNRCVAGDGLSCCKFGFTATKGFDPVTGLGSVDFDRLMQAILTLGLSPKRSAPIAVPVAEI